MLPFVRIAAVLVWCCTTAVWSAPVHETPFGVQAEIRQVVNECYPELRDGAPIAVVILSIQNCRNCALTAANHAIESVRSNNTSIPCIAVIVTSDSRDVPSLREQIRTPYIASDTLATHVHFAERNARLLPALALYGRGDTVLYWQEDIAHTIVDNDALQFYTAGSMPFASVVLSLPAAEETPVAAQCQEPRRYSLANGGALEMSPTRSLTHLLTPVMGRGRLWGINYMTGAIESWDRSTGAVLPPFRMPDTVRYFFRKDADDPWWRMAEEQGYELAQVAALRAVEDTVYALVALLQGYTMRVAAQANAAGGVDTTQSIAWHKAQVVVKIHRDSVQGIVPLSPKYFLLGLVADSSGAMGGVCMDETADAAGDSTVFFIRFHVQSILEQQKKTYALRVWRKKYRVGHSLGMAAMALSGIVWYCNPGHNSFLVLRRDGRAQAVGPHGVLAKCFMPVQGEEADSASGDTYQLAGIATDGDDTVLLVLPEGNAQKGGGVLCRYSSSGKHREGDELLLSSVLPEPPIAVHLLGVQEHLAWLLLQNHQKQWHLTPVALPEGW